MKVHAISTALTGTESTVSVTLTAHVTVQSNHAFRHLTITTAPHTFAPEGENDISVHSEEELWDFKHALRDLGFPEDSIEEAPFLLG